MKAACYRSKKKTSKPYSVIAAIDDQGAIVDGNCECAAGMVACNHLMGVLRTVSLLQAKGFSEAPEQISCTDLPQQWRVPRRSSKGRSIQEVDWRSVREGGLSVPKMGRPKDCRLYPRNQQQQQAAQEELARNLLSDSPECLFARGLLSTLGQPYKRTRYGPAPTSSPLAYQQALLPHGFAVRLSGIMPQPSPAAWSLPEISYFKDDQAWHPPAHLEGNQILQVCLHRCL